MERRGVGTGRREIEALVQRIRQSGTARQRAILHVTNIAIKVDGTGATAFSNWVVVQNSEHGPKIGPAGSYADELVKRDSVWLFRYRKIDRFIHDKA
jgi:hypothetical protein